MEAPQCDPPESLVKYEEPLFVAFDARANPTSPTTRDEQEGFGTTEDNDAKSPTSPGKKKAQQVESMVDGMLPPREWTQETGTWMQYTSKKPATRMDVIRLQEELDERLVERQARETGICPVREDLYSQTFDELVRQITLDGPERGLLLLRVRDEVRMTIDAYETLYESSVTFGVKKQLQAETGVDELQARIALLEDERKALENQVLELRNGVEVVEKRANEHKAIEDKKRKDEIDFLKYQGQHLDAFLRQLGGGGAVPAGGPTSGGGGGGK